MSIAVFPIGPLDTNCYVVHTQSDAIVVDPGGDESNGLADVFDYLKKHALTLRAVVLTHLHFDHIYGVAPLANSAFAPADGPVAILAGVNDFPMLSTSLGRGESFGFPAVTPFTPAPLAEGPCQFGQIRGEVFHTPGHTPGGLSLYLPEEQAVLAGDTLFCRSIGRTDLAGGDLNVLRASIVNKLFSLPDETVVHCGHGPDTSIGVEKKHNPYL